MTAGSPPRRSDCPLAAALDIVGDRWVLVILRDILRFGPVRFKQLVEAEEQISTNVLTDRLKKLEAAGLIHATLYQEHPPRMEYAASDSAWDILPAIEALATWAQRHLPGVNHNRIEFKRPQTS